ncbi:tumor necrosis factor receptor superfamily member 6 [Polyodon spathula]|uniref:tumor necrosis factor receptor superfamily member 6 n=1 Tax=Polyodon spathula TaxID=7913 RepID=UPI001B7E5B67|nr:tumor necrosis factor receptor superfamily member 6 [Polyodon spathula]
MQVSITDSKIILIFSFLQVAVLSTPVANTTKDSFASSFDHHNLVKRSTCPQDEHVGKNELCCKMCVAGQKLNEDCTTEHGYPTCEQCPLGTYTSHPNYLTACEACKICDINDGLVEELPCSNISNTECRCVKGFYCGVKTDCSHCTPCQKCSNSEIEEKECTPTSNTVCKPRAESDSKWWIYLIVLAILAILIGSVYCWRTKKLCFDKPAINENITTETNPLLPDIDLQPHLYFIADTVGFSETRKFLLTNGFFKGEVENIIGNHPNNVRDQTVELWTAWYQRHGIPNAYSTLIKKLQEMKLNRNAEAIIRNVKNSVQNSNRDRDCKDA